MMGQRDIILSAVAAAAFAFACRSATAGATPLDVSVSVDRTVISSSTPAKIFVKVLNRGAQPVETADPRSYACSRAFLVLDQAARPVDLPGRGCFAIAYLPITLAAGDSVVIADQWSADHNDAKGNVAPVQAGRYQVIARIFGDNRTLESDPAGVTVEMQ